AGAAGDVLMPGRPGDVDAAPDAVDPGRTGVGHHDAGGSEDRDAAQDAQPGIPGVLGDLLAAGDRDLDDQVGDGAAGELGDGRGHQLPGHRVDGGLADGQRQAGLGDRPDAGSGQKADS